jgi:hypothetical protein
MSVDSRRPTPPSAITRPKTVDDIARGTTALSTGSAPSTPGGIDKASATNNGARYNIKAVKRSQNRTPFGSRQARVRTARSGAASMPKTRVLRVTLISTVTRVVMEHLMEKGDLPN